MEHIYVMLIVLNIYTGAEVSRKIEMGPFEDVAVCAASTVGLPAELPKDDTIVVHECSISHVDKVS